MFIPPCRGDDFYPGVNSLGYGGRGKVSQAGIDRMVADLGKQLSHQLCPELFYTCRQGVPNSILYVHPK